MMRLVSTALLATLLGLGACSMFETPSRIGGESSAPNAQAGGNAGSVGGQNNSTRSGEGTAAP